jgi:hypothetical protein
MLRIFVGALRWGILSGRLGMFTNHFLIFISNVISESFDSKVESLGLNDSQYREKKNWNEIQNPTHSHSDNPKKQIAPKKEEKIASHFWTTFDWTNR